MYKVSYQFHHRAIDLDCVLLGEHRRDVGIALASNPENVLTVLKMHGPAEIVGAAALDDETFVVNRIGQAEMQHELDGVLIDALKDS
jgi:hypothetical protein